MVKVPSELRLCLNWIKKRITTQKSTLPPYIVHRTEREGGRVLNKSPKTSPELLDFLAFISAGRVNIFLWIKHKVDVPLEAVVC